MILEELCVCEGASDQQYMGNVKAQILCCVGCMLKRLHPVDGCHALNWNNLQCHAVFISLVTTSGNNQEIS